MQLDIHIRTLQTQYWTARAELSLRPRNGDCIMRGSRLTNLNVVLAIDPTASSKIRLHPQGLCVVMCVCRAMRREPRVRYLLQCISLKNRKACLACSVLVKSAGESWEILEPLAVIEPPRAGGDLRKRFWGCWSFMNAPGASLSFGALLKLLGGSCGPQGLPGASRGLLGLPGASWGALAAPGASWRLLGPPGGSWGLLGLSGVSWGLLGTLHAFWELLGLSWGLLGAGWASWGPLELPGSSWGLPGPHASMWSLVGPLGAFASTWVDSRFPPERHFSNFSQSCRDVRTPIKIFVMRHGIQRAGGKATARVCLMPSLKKENKW